MNFSQLHERLRAELLRRIQKGSLTGALLARRSGLAQPHISNFLQGKTRLSDEARDQVLAALGLSIESLLNAPPPRIAEPQTIAFPVLPADEIADADFRPTRGYLFIPDELLTLSPTLARRPAQQRFVATILTPDQAAPMHPVLLPYDTVLIDRHSTLPERPTRRATATANDLRPIYALQLEPRITLFRHIAYEPGKSHLLLQPGNAAYLAQSIPSPRSANHTSLILGRVVGLFRSRQFQQL